MTGAAEFSGKRNCRPVIADEQDCPEDRLDLVRHGELLALRDQRARTGARMRGRMLKRTEETSGSRP
jgi:hypothetical protein